MILWRISEFAELDGKGGLYANGRWHSKGVEIAYTAGSSALALLEALVRFERSRLPAPYQLLRIELPGNLNHEDWPNPMPPDSVAASRAWGDQWLTEGKTCLAKVPASVAPHSHNWLINPAHRDSPKIKVTKKSRWPWDKRLFL